MSTGRILVHCCCGPCATASVERLLNEGYAPSLFYSNCNIDTKEEYEKRAENLLRVADYYNVEAKIDSYDHKAWLEAIKGFEGEKEHGARCPLCWAFSFARAQKMAEEGDFPSFCTTLTVSRFKSSQAIFKTGEAFERFSPLDFKKKDGFNRSVKLSKELGLYRQNYCGCEFSKEEGRGHAEETL